MSLPARLLPWRLTGYSIPPGTRVLDATTSHRLTEALPAAVKQARPFAAKAPKGKDVFIFATLHYWIEQAAMIGVTLAGLGHRVTLAYLPYGDWRKEVTPFDLRRHALYTRDHLKPAEGLIKIVNLLDVAHSELPSALQEDIRLVAEYDTMYTDQVEEVDTSSPRFTGSGSPGTCPLRNRHCLT